MVAHAVSAGVDLGRVLWDAARPKRLLAHAPIVLTLAVLGLGAPGVLASILRTLAVPLAGALLGSIARLAGFVPRAGAVVATFGYGAAAGAIASGRVPLGTGDPVGSWLAPTPLVAGALAVASCAFVGAAVEGERLRAAGAGAVALALGLALAVAVVPAGAPELRSGVVTSRLALGLLVGCAGLVVLAVSSLLRRQLGEARVLAVLAVIALVVGWGAAQHPWLLVDVVTVDQAWRLDI